MSATKPVMVGDFMLSGLALGLAALLLFGGTAILSPTVHAVVYFQGSVANLAVGAPVTFRGVRVGSVSEISLLLNMTDLSAKIPVYLDINPKQIALQQGAHGKTDASFDRLLKAGLRAQLTMQSLITGQLIVDLDLRPESPESMIADDSGRPQIPSIPSKFQTLESEITDLPLKQMAENANRTLAAIREVTESLPALIGPLAQNLDRSAAAAQVTLHDIDALAITGRQQLAGQGDALRLLLNESKHTVQDADGMVLSFQSLVAIDGPMRSDLQASLHDLAASASALRGFTHAIERNPSLLLRSDHP